MPAGRPTLLTPEVIEEVRRILPVCLYLETVASYLGICRETLRQWLKRGQRERNRQRKNPKSKNCLKESIYVEFLDTYKKALAEGEIHDTGVIKKASQESWQAAAWRLERRFPSRWGRKDKAIDDEQINKAIEAQLEKLAPKPKAGVPQKTTRKRNTRRP